MNGHFLVHSAALTTGAGDEILLNADCVGGKQVTLHFSSAIQLALLIADMLMLSQRLRRPIPQRACDIAGENRIHDAFEASLEKAREEEKQIVREAIS